MADILPPAPEGENTPPDTCREYLGKARGYCPDAPQFTSSHDGRRFCVRHARERGL